MRIIAGTWKGHALQAPKNRLVRPTSDRIREALFSVLESGMSLSQVHVLDLFAGTGALGLEALSRGAAQCCFVEHKAAACAVIEANIQALKARQATRLMRRDATRLGRRPAQTPVFDLVFIDPPYGKGLAEKTLTSLRAGGWLAEKARLVVEEDRRSAFAAPQGFAETDRRIYGGTELVLLRA